MRISYFWVLEITLESRKSNLNKYFKNIFWQFCHHQIFRRINWFRVEFSKLVHFNFVTALVSKSSVPVIGKNSVYRIIPEILLFLINLRVKEKKPSWEKTTNLLVIHVKYAFKIQFNKCAMHFVLKTIICYNSLFGQPKTLKYRFQLPTLTLFGFRLLQLSQTFTTF